MPDPTPAQQIRNLCDQISDLMEASLPTAGVQRLSDAPGATTEPRLPMHHDTVEARDHLKQILTSWALLIVEEKRVHYDGRNETTAVAAWIHQQADWMATHPAFDDFITEVEEAIHGLSRIVNRGVSSRKFCGWDNGRPVFANGNELSAGDAAGQTLRNGRAALAITVLDVDLPAKDCAEALKLHGHDITAKQILKLHEVDERRRTGGTLGPHEGLSPIRREGGRNTPVFRVSEVLARLTRQHAS